MLVGGRAASRIPRTARRIARATGPYQHGWLTPPCSSCRDGGVARHDTSRASCKDLNASVPGATHLPRSGDRPRYSQRDCGEEREKSLKIAYFPAGASLTLSSETGVLGPKPAAPTSKSGAQGQAAKARILSAEAPTPSLRRWPLSLGGGSPFGGIAVRAASRRKRRGRFWPAAPALPADEARSGRGAGHVSPGDRGRKAALTPVFGLLPGRSGGQDYSDRWVAERAVPVERATP